MKLIREEIESVEFIVEERNGKKSLFIEGVFLQGDIKNRNGRVYPMETLRREVARYNENHIQQGRALGELGHPDGPTVNERVFSSWLPSSCAARRYLSRRSRSLALCNRL